MDKPIELELSVHHFLAVITGTEHGTGLCPKLLANVPWYDSHSTLLCCM